jgi:hypothetical protein
MDLSAAARGYQMKEETQSYSPLPEGYYNVVIDSAEECKNGALRVQFSIQHEKYSGRKVSGFFNFNHPKPKKAEFDLSKYGELLQAIGFIDLQANPQAAQHGFQDSAQIRTPEDLARQKRPLNLKVKISEHNPQNNEIAFYNRIQDNQADRQQFDMVSGMGWGQQQAPNQQQQQSQAGGHHTYQAPPQPAPQQQQAPQQEYAQEWGQQQQQPQGNQNIPF